MLCRHRKTLQNDATSIKLRIFSWLGLTTPGLSDVIGTDLSRMDRDFIRRYPVVARIVRLGRKRLLDFLQRRSRREVDPALVDDLFELAQTAYSPRDLDDKLVADQIGMELKRLELIERQIGELDGRIEPLLSECDPEGLARSIPGFGKVVAPIMVAEAGTDVSRFANPSRFAGWTGLVAKAHGSSAKHAEGLPITKAGRATVKCALFLAANIARQNDPDLGDLYQRLRDKGKHHNVAVNAVAHKLARIYWAVMTYRKPYQIQSQKGLDTH
jgi:transposase